METDLSHITNLTELEQTAKSCTLCALGQTRTNVVFGVGNPSSDLVFVGEAPGFHEDQKGEPFVGAAGRYLDELLITVLGLTRKDIYIANVLKCRPPGNRDPQPEEIQHCRQFLNKQIELIKPKVICSLGNHASRVILDKSLNISKVHGQPVNFDKHWIFPTYHPAAALYTGKIKEILIEDFKKLGEILAQDSLADKGESDTIKQMDLF
ncbi:MAG TPA: uracil-DNA glycosylase [Actinobacteria bacterium]|nr:uracil-DNA glycosylase [Actinomycetota bacterium]